MRLIKEEVEEEAEEEAEEKEALLPCRGVIM